MKPVIVLVSNVLRLNDHPALHKACEIGAPVVPVFILDEKSEKIRPLGAASKWWLMQSLEVLSSAYESVGSRLILKKGKTLDVVSELIDSLDPEAVYLTRGYTPGQRQLEDALNGMLKEREVECRRFAGNLLLEPEHVRTQKGDPYTVFTPYWRTARDLIDRVTPLEAPKSITAPESWPDSLTLDALDLAPKPVNWASGMEEAWQVGTQAALERLDDFLEEIAQGYQKSRDLPGQDGTSRLSPYLAFGEISPRMIWYRALDFADKHENVRSGIESFLRELGWRDFCAHLLFHHPEMQTQPLREAFNAFPWQEGEGEDLGAWQRGQTGFPIVDAGMRQLWQTGWMHNRVRMIVASFLVKDLLWHWRDGEAWFWDTLVDADFGSNIANWQWVAGCGADAAPYFRIFNPVTQSEKFDKNAAYIRQFVPELADLPDKYIHAPFDAPADVLKKAGVVLGQDYPKPLVDRKKSRARALEAFEETKKD